MKGGLTMGRTLRRNGGAVEGMVNNNPGLNGTICQDDLMAVCLGGFMHSLARDGQWLYRYFFLEEEFMNEYLQEMDHHLHKQPVRQANLAGSTISLVDKAGSGNRPALSSARYTLGSHFLVIILSSRQR